MLYFTLGVNKAFPPRGVGEDKILQVNFRTKKLEKQYLDGRTAAAAYGPDVGRRYIQRVILLKSVSNVSELSKLPGLRYHPLTGDRKGQHAITLIGRWRLIFTLSGNTLDIAMVEEVSNHYDD